MTGLYVDSIKDKSGTKTLATLSSSAVTLNSASLPSGNVDSWHCTLLSGIDIDSDTVLDFTTQLHIGSNITESGGVITVGTAGYYYVYCSLANGGTSGTESDTMQFKLRKGGSKVAGARIYWESATGTPAYYSASSSWLVQCSASDTLDIYGYGDLQGGNGVNGSQDALCQFLGFRIGS